ncbi:hypothetical protein BGZ49_001891 [Haplosporangium sp. Z 27]|nr:hypothetical protein BGZ49_001891 [Haplosporangium sp. Z 27]
MPDLPPTTVEYLLKVKQAVVEQRAAISVPMPNENTDECELILDTFRTCKIPSPFVVSDLSESFWGRKSWPILMELLDSQPNMYMIDGEKTGLESSKRKNHGRQWKQDSPISRKKMGKRFDLIGRDVVDKKDWFLVERMKNWDELSSKFLKESGCDLFRETYTIMKHRSQDSTNLTFKDTARFFGVYTGDRGFKSFEIRPAGEGTYISLFKEFPVYGLPTQAIDMKPHVQGIVHLLQIRKCLIETINLHHRTEPTNQEKDISWIYDNTRSRLGSEITLASSPISSQDFDPFVSPEFDTYQITDEEDFEVLEI